MNAKHNDLSRLQEMYDVIVQTKRQMHVLSFGKERFVNPQNDEDDLIAEEIMNRVLRVTEEAGVFLMKLRNATVSNGMQFWV